MEFFKEIDESNLKKLNDLISEWWTQENMPIEEMHFNDHLYGILG